jgi:hypothetical protein
MRSRRKQEGLRSLPEARGFEVKSGVKYREINFCALLWHNSPPVLKRQGIEAAP